MDGVEQLLCEKHGYQRVQDYESIAARLTDEQLVA